MSENNANPNPQAEERELTEKEIGEQRQIKRKKLEELREMGREWRIRRSESQDVSWLSAAWAR